jgi:glycerol-3-phosphate dehydrogenase
MNDLRREGQLLLPEIRVTDYIRSFAGIRPKQTPPEVGGNKDFVIEDRKDAKGFINLVGIESPGLTSAPAIAQMARDMVGRHITLIPDPSFDPVRPGSPLYFSELPAEERAARIADNPNYGEIICRCEKITKQEIIDAINNPLGAKTLVSIKYRARSSMGRCQGGFCVPRITRILRNEFGWTPEDFLKRGRSSPLFAGTVRPEKKGVAR